MKYEGKGIGAGLMDARSAARALIGLDRSLRYFVTKQEASLVEQDFDIPVKIEKGSWVASIPDTIGTLITAGAVIVATSYFSTAAKKMAENDFKDKGIKDAFRWSLQAVQWMIRLGKHLGSLKFKKLTGIRWEDNGNIVLIPGKTGILRMPRDFFRAMQVAPTDLISDMASIVKDGRILSVGVDDCGTLVETKISSQERSIFCLDDDETQDVLFPELAHGMSVSLDGFVTRGNGVNNSIGFQYNGHILSCTPQSGKVVKFKGRLFLPARILGTISRYDQKTKCNDHPRPQIIFDDLLPINNQQQEPDLFAKIHPDPDGDA